MAHFTSGIKFGTASMRALDVDSRAMLDIENGRKRRSHLVGIASIFAIWLGLGFLAGLANLHDGRAAGFNASIWRHVTFFILLLLPLPILGSVLYLICENYRDQIIRPRNLLILLLALLFLFMPIFTLYELSYMHYRSKKTLPNSAELYVKFSTFYFLIDSMIVMLAASMQLAFAYWKINVLQFHQSYTANQEILALRLKKLRGQLEPDFLLHSLRQVADYVVVAEKKEAFRAVVRLSDMLRYVLDSQQEENLSVADEIDFLNCYVELQNLRFNDTIQIEWDLSDEKWKDYHSIPLLLYPLVDYVIETLQEHCSERPLLIRFHLCLVQSLRQPMIQVIVFCVSNCRFDGIPSERLRTARERLALSFNGMASLQFVESTFIAAQIEDAKSELPYQGLHLLFPARRIRND